MSTIQTMAARARRECDINGLPAGDYVYQDPLKIENRYQSEGGAIREQYGTIANWRAWEPVHIVERATGRTVFDSEAAKITGMTLHATPAEVLAVLDQSIYEVKEKGAI
jgi:hypothetical protein